MDRQRYYFERGFRYSGVGTIAGTESEGSASADPKSEIVAELTWAGFENIATQPNPLDPNAVLWRAEWWKPDGLYELGLMKALGNDGPTAMASSTWPSGWPANLKPQPYATAPLPGQGPSFLDWSPGSAATPTAPSSPGGPLAPPAPPPVLQAGTASGWAGFLVLAVGLLFLGRFLR